MTHVELMQFTFVCNRSLIVTRETVYLKDKSKKFYLKTRIQNYIVEKYRTHIFLLVIIYPNIFFIIILEIDKKKNTSKMKKIKIILRQFK